MIADAERESDAGQSLGERSSTEFDHVAASSVGADAVDRNAVGVLESGAEELGSRDREVRGEDNDGLGVSEIVPVRVGCGWIERAATQEASRRGKCVNWGRVAAFLAEGLEDLLKITRQGGDGVLTSANQLGLKETNFIADDPTLRGSDLEPYRLEPGGNEILDQKVHVATVAAPVAHNVHDEAASVLLEERDLALKLLDGLAFVERCKARDPDEADGLVADGESPAEEFVGGVSSKAKLEARWRIEERHRRVKGEKSACGDVVRVLGAELPKPATCRNRRSRRCGSVSEVSQARGGRDVPRIGREPGAQLHGLKRRGAGFRRARKHRMVFWIGDGSFLKERNKDGLPRNGEGGGIPRGLVADHDSCGVAGLDSAGEGVNGLEAIKNRCYSNAITAESIAAGIDGVRLEDLDPRADADTVQGNELVTNGESEYLGVEHSGVNEID